MAYKLFQSGAPSQMTRAKVELLDAESFSWAYENKRDKRWHELYGELLKFKEAHGHCNVPKKYRENQRLGSWVDYQRTLYRQTKRPEPEGNPEAISAERIRLLEAVNFRWTTAKGKGLELTTANPNEEEEDSDRSSRIVSEPVALYGTRRGVRNGTDHQMPFNAVVSTQQVPPPLVSQAQASPNMHPPPPMIPTQQYGAPRVGHYTNVGKGAPVAVHPPQTRAVPQQQYAPQVVRVIQHVANPSPVYAQLPPPPVMQHHINGIQSPAPGGTTIYVVTAPGQPAPPPEVIQQLSGVAPRHSKDQQVIHCVVYH